MKNIITNVIESDFYFTLFIYIIAQFESYLVDVIFTILKYDERKIRINVQGTENNKKIEVSDLLECNNYDNVINLIIENQLSALFYASPKKQVEYIEKILVIKIEENFWNKWFEYKATRDIIVHNSGIINKIYIEKSGKNSRGNMGEKIVIDKKYFEDCLITIKSIIGKISGQGKKLIK